MSELDPMTIHEDTYIVSPEDCAVVDPDTEIPDNVLVGHAIVEGERVYDELIQGENVTFYELSEPYVPVRVDVAALYNAIEEKLWEEATELLSCNENQTKLVNYAEKWNGWTVLHQACVQRFIPIALFEHLLTVCKEIYGDELPIDKWGDTALHLACQHAMDEITSMILDHFPSAASVQNKHGGLPLHTAIHYDSSSFIIHELLLAHPKSIHVKNNHNNTPLQRFINTERYIFPPPIITPDSFPLCGGDHEEICKVLTLLLQYHVQTSKSDCNPEIRSSFLILHVSLHVNVPIQFVHLVLSKYPEEICKEDMDGNMPIHIAASITDETYRQKVLQSLVTTYPRCVRVPNRQGRLPIAILAENDVTNNDIEFLFHKCAFVSGTRDMTTHLYPFISAGLGIKGNKQNKEILKRLLQRNEKDKLQRMTNSLSLLLENPAVIKECKPLKK